MDPITIIPSIDDKQVHIPTTSHTPNDPYDFVFVILEVATDEGLAKRMAEITNLGSRRCPNHQGT